MTLYLSCSGAAPSNASRVRCAQVRRAQTGGMIRRRAVVHGEVQGVGFRYAARQKASELGLAGFVRNRRDGSVEAEIEGADAAVKAMLEWLGEGPAWARVRRVDVEDLAPVGDAGFSIRR